MATSSATLRADPGPRSSLAVAVVLFAVATCPAACSREGSRGGRGSAGASPRVLLIGLDGADLRIIDRLVAAGRLPTFARLEREGAFGALRSQAPLISPIVWTTIATGRRPEDHGVLDFLEVGPEGPAPITSTRRRVPALWNVAGEFSRSSGFVGWYGSYPAEKVRGFEISDRLGFHQVRSARAEKGATYPEELALELAAQFGRPAPDPAAARASFSADAAPISEDGRRRLEELARIVATTEYYAAVLPELQRRYRPDLLAVYFEAIDACGHLFMEDAPPRRPEILDEDFRAFSDTLDRCYAYQDRVLERLLRLEGPDTVSIIVSDHGFAVGDERPKVSGRADTGQAALWHRLNGIVFVHGAGVRRGRLASAGSVYDVAPTVLVALGVPVSRELPGSPWSSLFAPGTLPPARAVDRYPPRPPPSRDAPRASDPEALRKLAALGYLAGSSRALPHDPDGRTASSYFNEGLARSEAGDVAGALRAYGRCVELDPANAKALLAAAALEIRNRRLDRAADLLERARRIDPDDYWVHLESASLDLQAGRVADAGAHLDAAERRENRLPSLYLVRARYWKASGQNERALASLDQAEQLSDRDATLGEILVLRGQIQTELGRLESADRSLAAAEGLAAAGPLAAARGELAFARRDGASAERFFRAALRANPESSVLERKLGETLGAMGKLEDGRAAFERAIAKAANTEEKEGAFGDLSLLAQREGKPEENLKALTRATRELPQSSALWAMLGAAYGRAHDYERAIAAYEKSVSIRPTALACKTLAALLFETRGDRGRAIALWKRSLALDPTQRDVREFLRRYGGGDRRGG